MASAPEEIIDPEDETEVQMILRIEAEERARLEAEDHVEEARSLQMPAGARSAVPSGGQLGGFLARFQMPCGGGSATGSSGGRVDLSTVAYRFGMLGLMAFGGSPAQVALMRSQPGRSEVADDAAFSSVVALCECLPGFTAAQVASALGVLQAGVYGGFVAVAAYAAASTLALTLIGVLPTP